MNDYIEVRKKRKVSKQNETYTFVIKKDNKAIYFRNGAIGLLNIPEGKALMFFLSKSKQKGKIIIEDIAFDNYKMYRGNDPSKNCGLIQSINLVEIFQETFDLKEFELTKISDTEFEFKPTV